ncbi:uncharacterized protein METZ01_LOCUS246573, partial [marine metagenome]
PFTLPIQVSKFMKSKLQGPSPDRRFSKACSCSLSSQPTALVKVNLDKIKGSKEKLLNAQEG